MADNKAELVMAKRSRNDCGTNRVDRISNLPRNLIDLILERLPVQARTTVLSRTWRNIWAMHPQLVFDKTFFSQLVTKMAEQAQPYEVSTIISNMPNIYGVFLDGFFLKFSEPGASPFKKLVTMENLNTLLLTCIDIYDLIQIRYVLCLNRSSPNLHLIDILLKWDSAESLAARNWMETLAASRVDSYLQSPNFDDMILYHLKDVVIHGMLGSRLELRFIKLLLASSPSLRRMKLCKSPVIVDPKEELKVLGELMRYPRASTTAQIIWA